MRILVRSPTMTEVHMDLFPVAFAIVPIALGGIVIGGLVALVKTRSNRRDRLAMKQHVQRMELTGR